MPDLCDELHARRSQWIFLRELLLYLKQTTLVERYLVNRRCHCRRSVRLKIPRQGFCLIMLTANCYLVFFFQQERRLLPHEKRKKNITSLNTEINVKRWTMVLLCSCCFSRFPISGPDLIRLIHSVSIDFTRFSHQLAYQYEPFTRIQHKNERKASRPFCGGAKILWLPTRRRSAEPPHKAKHMCTVFNNRVKNCRGPAGKGLVRN